MFIISTKPRLFLVDKLAVPAIYGPIYTKSLLEELYRLRGSGPRSELSQINNKNPSSTQQDYNSATLIQRAHPKASIYSKAQCLTSQITQV